MPLKSGPPANEEMFRNKVITGEKRRFGRDMIVAFNYLKEGGNWN